MTIAMQIQTKFIANDAITTAKILNANVTGAKIESSAALAGSPTTTTQSAGVNNTTIATTAFVTTALGAWSNGLKPKAPVRAATLIPGTLATSFADSSVIDGITLATGNRILIKNQSTASENGIYVVAASGAPARAADFDSLTPIDEIHGAWVAIQEGTQAGKVFVQYGTVVTIDVTAINFTYWDPIAGLIGGDMITVSGSTITVDLAAVSGLESSNAGNAGGQLRIKLEASNPTLAIDGSNQIGIKLNAAGAIVTGASGIKIQVSSTGGIEINGSNELQIKAASVTNAMLAGSIDLTAKVTGTLPIGNGGTGASSLAGYGVLVMNAGGTAATSVAPGTNGNILTSNGTSWSSAAPAPVYAFGKEKITLDGDDITAGYVDLAQDVQVDSIVAQCERMSIQKTEDYTTSVVSTKTRITFVNSLAVGGDEALVAGDMLFFTYQFS